MKPVPALPGKEAWFPVSLFGRNCRQPNLKVIVRYGNGNRHYANCRVKCKWGFGLTDTARQAVNFFKPEIISLML